MSKTKPPHASVPENLDVVHQPAWDVREVIWPLFEGFYASTALRAVATLEYRKKLGKNAPAVDVVTARGDGQSGHKFDLDTYLDLAHTKPQIAEAMKRVWPVGALLTAADALDYYNYFDRAPCLELIYHLRNGVGHGNHFHFDQAAEARMKKYPAHNRDSIRGDRVHEISPELNGTEVLETFMNSVDVQDCFQAAVQHLDLMAQGTIPSKQRKPIAPA